MAFIIRDRREKQISYQTLESVSIIRHDSKNLRQSVGSQNQISDIVSFSKFVTFDDEHLVFFFSFYLAREII